MFFSPCFTVLFRLTFTVCVSFRSKVNSLRIAAAERLTTLMRNIFLIISLGTLKTDIGKSEKFGCGGELLQSVVVFSQACCSRVTIRETC